MYIELYHKGLEAYRKFLYLGDQYKKLDPKCWYRVYDPGLKDSTIRFDDINGLPMVEAMVYDDPFKAPHRTKLYVDSEGDLGIGVFGREEFEEFNT